MPVNDWGKDALCLSLLRFAGSSSLLKPSNQLAADSHPGSHPFSLEKFALCHQHPAPPAPLPSTPMMPTLIQQVQPVALASCQQQFAPFGSEVTRRMVCVTGW